jgi:hypothetical protein
MVIASPWKGQIEQSVIRATYELLSRYQRNT